MNFSIKICAISCAIFLFVFNRLNAQDTINTHSFKIDSNIVFKSNDSVTIGATLTLPVGKGSFPAVVIISGTGKQDRDGNMAGHKLFKVIAEYLSSKGIAVLRMDDRGVGRTTGKYDTSTTGDFAMDALAAVNFLRTLSDINPKEIGLLGHSEGGAVISIAAAKSKNIKFLVSMAGLCMSGLDAQIVQNRDIVNHSSLDEATKKRSNEINELMFRTALKYADSTDMEAKLNEVYNRWKIKDDAYFKTLGQKFDHFRFPIYSYSKMAAGPWYRYFIKYDAAKTLSSVGIPILALNGEEDLMVSCTQNLANWKSFPLRGNNKDVTTIALPHVNHLFLPCNSCTIQEYTTIRENISTDVLQKISNWINERFH